MKQIKRGFPAACEEAGIEDFTFHDLRHTWATRAEDAGAKAVAIRDCLGHKPVSTTGGYTHATPEAMAEAMELVANYGRTDDECGKTAEKVAV